MNLLYDQGDDQLIHFQWKNRQSGSIVDVSANLNEGKTLIVMPTIGFYYIPRGCFVPEG